MRYLRCLAVLLLFTGLSGVTHAQVMQGQWVDASEKAINKHRKTDIEVIVLDRNDRALEGVEVEVVQTRHDFVLGLAVSPDQAPPKDLQNQPVYRCFNAIAMDRFTDWSSRESQTQSPAAQVLKRWNAAIHPIESAFGRVISADPALNADELSLLEPRDLRDVLMARIDYATSLKPGPDSYDLYSDLIYQDMIQRKLGYGMIHRMFEQAKAKRPDATMSLRMRDAVSLQRGREVVTMVHRLQTRQIPFDAVTIEQRFNGQINPNAMQRMFDNYLSKLKVPVTFSGLEIGGPTPVAAGLNTETVIRIAFAQPNLRGIYFAGLVDEELIEPNAGLLDAKGEPTPSGLAVDGLFQKHWWSHEKIKTDERGNAQTRVFTGWYRVTAKLPNGKTLTAEAYVPKSDRAKLIVLQATAVEQPVE